MGLVYVTGLGVVSPLGNEASAFADSLQRGDSGLEAFTGFDLSYSGCKLAGQVRGLAEGGSRLSRMADLAAQGAISLAKWTPGEVDPSRCAVFVSSSKGGMEAFGRA